MGCGRHCPFSCIFFLKSPRFVHFVQWKQYGVNMRVCPVRSRKQTARRICSKFEVSIWTKKFLLFSSKHISPLQLKEIKYAELIWETNLWIRRFFLHREIFKFGQGETKEKFDSVLLLTHKIGIIAKIMN